MTWRDFPQLCTTFHDFARVSTPLFWGYRLYHTHAALHFRSPHGFAQFDTRDDENSTKKPFFNTTNSNFSRSHKNHGKHENHEMIFLKNKPLIKTIPFQCSGFQGKFSGIPWKSKRLSRAFPESENVRDCRRDISGHSGSLRSQNFVCCGLFLCS